MNFNLKFIGFGLFLLFNSLLFAQKTGCDTVSCDKCICCSSIDPTPAGQMISHVHEKNEWMVSVRSMNMAMDGLLFGTKNDMLSLYGYSQDNMQMNMYMLMAMYGVSSRLTVMGMFSYNTNYMEMTMKSGNTLHPHAMQTQGFGDTKLTVLYAFVKKSSYHLLLSAGANLPTGSIYFKGGETDMMYPNRRYPYEMQTGSGSFDALPGICYLQKLNKFTYSIQLASVIRLNKNAIGYKLGNEAVLNTWMAYQILPFLSSSIRMEAITIGKTRGYDPNLMVFDDYASLTSAYGGQYVNAYLGMNVRAKKGAFNKLTLGFEYGLPVYQDLNGIQLKTKQLVNASLAFRF